MVQIAPGLYAKHSDAKRAQEMTIAAYIEDAPGSAVYRLVARPERMVRITKHLLELLGMPRQRMTLMRLSAAGMIEIVKPAPNTCLLNLDSWFNHLRRCAEDPDIWAPGGKYLKEYRRAIG